MTPVLELDWISADLAVWHGFDPIVRCECGSSAILTKPGWLVFDPLPLSENAWSELLSVSKVHAIALTSANHQRESLSLRPLLDAPIHALESARGEIEADVWLKDRESVAGFSIIELPGAATGEAVYCDGNHLVTGDALIHFDQLEILPDKYCTDPPLLRKSLRKLTGLEFHTALFAHGLPLVSKAHEQIAKLVG